MFTALHVIVAKCLCNRQEERDRCKKYMKHLCFSQLEESALAEHVMDAGYFIKFNSTFRLGVATGYMDHWVQKAVEVMLYLINFGRNGNFL